MNWKEDGYAKCPYYQRHGGRVIVCESPMEYEGVDTVLYTSPTGDRTKYMTKYCRGEWRNCPIARDIERKYNKREEF